MTYVPLISRVSFPSWSIPTLVHILTRIETREIESFIWEKVEEVWRYFIEKKKEHNGSDLIVEEIEDNESTKKLSHKLP